MDSSGATKTESRILSSHGTPSGPTTPSYGNLQASDGTARGVTPQRSREMSHEDFHSWTQGSFHSGRTKPNSIYSIVEPGSGDVRTAKTISTWNQLFSSSDKKPAQSGVVNEGFFDKFIGFFSREVEPSPAEQGKQPFLLDIDPNHFLTESQRDDISLVENISINEEQRKIVSEFVQVASTGVDSQQFIEKVRELTSKMPELKNLKVFKELVILNAADEVTSSIVHHRELVKELNLPTNLEFSEFIFKQKNLVNFATYLQSKENLKGKVGLSFNYHFKMQDTSCLQATEIKDLTVNVDYKHYLDQISFSVRGMHKYQKALLEKSISLQLKTFLEKNRVIHANQQLKDQKNAIYEETRKITDTFPNGYKNFAVHYQEFLAEEPQIRALCLEMINNENNRNSEEILKIKNKIDELINKSDNKSLVVNKKIQLNDLTNILLTPLKRR